MYCIKCGVQLAESERKCPLCNTIVYHPDFLLNEDAKLYPDNKMPKRSSGTKALSGAVIILFLLPAIICFFADLLNNGILNWWGYVAGALVVTYVSLALPMWFERPNPVIFVPCGFAAAAAYLWYVDFATDGTWFLSFALPVLGALCVITCTVVTLTHYLRGGKLYIFGGAFMALGALSLLIEFLLGITFKLAFIWWSIYPLVSLFLLGGLLIYLAIDSSAREVVERKLFF